MVNKEIVLDTIKKMKSSGIDDSVIVTTLKDIGLDDREIKSYLKEAGGSFSAADASEDEKQEKVASKAADKIKAHLAEEKEERELRETTAQNALNEQHAKIESVEQNVGKLHSKFESLATPGNKDLANQIAVIEQRLNSIEKRLSDLKALDTATKELMEKVLEVNRKTLSKL